MGVMEFNQMLVSNSEFLKPFAITLTRDSEIAKDLFQETLFRALANRDKYNVGTNIRAWLYTIMRNIFINDYRRKMKQQSIISSASHEYLLENQPAVEPTSESVMRLKNIQMHIHRLPEIFKLPFVLYVEGYHYHEISRILREPLGTIKSRIHFARKMLKSQVERN